METKTEQLRKEACFAVGQSFLNKRNRITSKIKAICRKVKKAHDIDVDIENIPMNDKKTFELFQQGKTEGIFSFDGFSINIFYNGQWIYGGDYLREVRTTCFEDLVALYAMFRPGMMDFIPLFAERKNGKNKIRYILPCMEECLKETYGIIVYWEQLTQLSHVVAGFSADDYNDLRNAICKKMEEVLSAVKLKFIEGGQKNGYSKRVLLEVWAQMEEQGQYAYIKPYAAYKTWLAYQMAYLKANYPEEFNAVT